jgi:hypothetical protein
MIFHFDDYGALLVFYTGRTLSYMYITNLLKNCFRKSEDALSCGTVQERMQVKDCERHRRRLRSHTQQVASVKDNETTNYDKSAKITRTITMSFSSTLLAMILIISEQFTRSTCLITKHGSPSRSRSHFHYSNHQQYHRLEHHLFPVGSNSRSRSLPEISQKYLYWPVYSSVMGLFEVLEEEADDDIDWDDVHGIASSKSPLSEINDDDDDDNDDDNDNDNNNDIKEEEENEDRISDAEALLACWSFLKRRKRLGDWNEHEERQAQNALSQNYFLTDDEAGGSILDEDDDDDDDDDDNDVENETLEDTENDSNFYNIINDDGSSASITTVQDILSASSPMNNDKYRFDGDGDDDDDVAKDLMAISSFVSDSPTATKGIGIGIGKNSETEDIDLWYTEFTSFPSEPSDSRTRRVDAMKRRWEDPDYRERWHKKRWGSESNHQRKKYTQQQTDRERQAVQRARALPSGFLGSDELASMTEEEIADAIRTRIRSTRKRVAKRKQTLQGRKDVLAAQIKALETVSEEDDDDYDYDDNHFRDDEDTVPREILFSPTKKTLEEAQQKRSERAKKLYATRLKNQKRHKENENQSTEESSLSVSSSSLKTKSPTRNKGPYFPPKQLTPQDAFLRIESDLDDGIKKPAIDDVRLVMEPGRMKNRKLLLRRILQDEFNLRGKCVPPISNKGNEKEDNNLNDVNGHDEHELEFVTHCTIERLGTFVIHLLEKEDSS